MNFFKHDMICQEYVNIIYNEGRVDDLLNTCDYYHPEIPDKNAAFEWGVMFGAYLGKFFYDIDVYKFEPIGSKYVFYFIGSLKCVKEKISKAL